MLSYTCISHVEGVKSLFDLQFDSNMKSLNYSKIPFKALIYFELELTLNQNFELKPLQIR